MFTDGSWERDIAGLGAVLLDESTGNRLVVQDRVQDEFLDLWRDLVGDQLICQTKLFAMVPVRWEWQIELSNRRVLLFVDNNSARSGVVKGRSDSPTMDDSIKAFHSIEVHLPSFWWVERAPNKSNPGDEPSRFEGKASAAVGMHNSCRGLKCQAKVADWLIKTASQRSLGCLSWGNGNRSVPGE